MKKIEMLVVAALFSMIPFFSVATAAEDKISAGISEQLLSGYLGDCGFRISNHSVSQTDVWVSYKGFTFDAWVSQDLSGDRDGDEVDFTISYAIEDIWRGVSLDIGLAYFDIPNPEIFSGIEGDFIQPFFELQKDFQITDDVSISPFLRGEFCFSTDGGENTIVHLGIKHSWKINDAFSLNDKIVLVSDLGENGSAAGSLALYRGALNWKISDTIDIDLLIVKMTQVVSGARDREDFESVAGTGINFNF